MSTPGAATAPVYVGFWPRVGAALIDTFWVTVLLVPLLALSGETDARETVISWGIPALAIIAFWRRKLATPGKMVIGAQIVDARTLAAPTFRQLVIRYIGYYFSTLPLGLGLLWVAFDPRKQGWHDKLAGTVVIRRRP